MITEEYKNRLKVLSGIISELKHNHKNEYGALMLDIDYPDWSNITSTIDKEDIYDDEPGFGVEYSPHCTVLFGFHKNADVGKIKTLVKEKQTESVKITVGDITHFETPKYDVVKFDVVSKDMHALNKLMTDNFDYTNDYPDYHPHMTIAYVKKGLGKKYDKISKKLEMTGNVFIYSPSDGKKEKFKVFASQ